MWFKIDHYLMPTNKLSSPTIFQILITVNYRSLTRSNIEKPRN